MPHQHRSAWMKRAASNKPPHSQHRRRPLLESLESRNLLASDFQNPLYGLDVTDDGVIAADDVLTIINEINARGARQLSNALDRITTYVDINGDKFVVAEDALAVINHINAQHTSLDLDVQLAADTGDSSNDRLTNDSRIAAAVTSAHAPIVSAKIRMNRGSVFEVPVDASGSFVATPGIWGPIDEGLVRAKVYMQDANGVIGLKQFSFTLDTTAPTPVTLDLDSASDTGPLADRVTTASTVRLTGQREANSSIELVGASDIPEFAGNQFSFPDVTLAPGSSQFSVRSTDAAGNSSIGTTSFYRPQSGPITLDELHDRVSRVSVPLYFDKYEGQRTISFDVASNFDKTDTTQKIPDTFSVYLVKDGATTLVDRGVSDTALFSLDDRGTNSAPSAAGVTFANGHVSINTSYLSGKGAATLVFELFNADSDDGGTITVSNLVNSIDPSTQPAFRLQQRSSVAVSAPAVPDDLSLLLNDAIDVNFDNLRIDPETNTVTLDARLFNHSGGAAGRDVEMILQDLPFGMTLVNRGGDSSLGPVVNFRNAIPELGLANNTYSDRVQLRFQLFDLNDFEFNPTINILARSAALELFEDVYNNYEFKPYRGAMQGVEGIRDTKSGNAWDQAALLIDRLRAAGLTSNYVFGRVEANAADVINWLGAKNAAGAQLILDKAGLKPTAVTQDLGDGPVITAFQFDHAWVETRQYLPGSPVINVQLDPSFKLKTYQPGIPNISTLVPFDDEKYLSGQIGLQPQELYSQFVSLYLQANMPGTTLADVPYTGTLNQIRLAELPASLPYTVTDTPVIAATVPYAETHRVILTLDDLKTDPLSGAVSGSIHLQFEFSMPLHAHHRITVTWKVESLLLKTPELRIDGVVVATGTPMPFNGNVHVNLQKFRAGDLLFDDTTATDYPVGEVFAIGFNAQQIGPGMLAAQRSAIDQAGLDHLAGRPVDFDQQVGAVLALTVATYWDDTSRAEELMAGLTQGQRTYNFIESGFAQLDSPNISYYPNRPIIAVPDGLTVNIPQPSWEIINLDGSSTVDGVVNDPTRYRVVTFLGSTAEQHVLEELFGVDAICAVKAIQLAHENGIPVFTLDIGTKEELFPQLNLPDYVEAAMEAYIDAGVTVITPQRSITDGSFTGAGYLIQTADGFFGALLASAFGAKITGDGGGGGGPPECECPIAEDMSPFDWSRSPSLLPVRVTPKSEVEFIPAMQTIPNPEPPPAGGDLIKGLSPAGPDNVPGPKAESQAVRGYDGSLVREANDVDLPNIGAPLVFTRTYDSGREPADGSPPEDVGFGTGWTHTYSHHLEFNPLTITDEGPGNFVWITDSGRRRSFGLNQQSPEKGDYTPLADAVELAGIFRRIENASGVFYIYTDTDGSHYDFDADGKLIGIFDRHDYGVLVRYDDSGRLSSVVSNADTSRGFSFTYDGPHIIGLQESTGRSWSYGYDDGNGGTSPQLRSATFSSGNYLTAPHTTSYTYYTEQDGVLNRLLRRIDDSNGESESYTYYPNRWIQSYHESNGGSGTYVYTETKTVNGVPGTRIAHFTNELGIRTTYEYTSGGPGEAEPAGLLRSLTRTGPGGVLSSTRYKWSGRGQLQTTIDYNGHLTSQAYDEFLNVTKRIEADGATYLYEYNSPFHLLTKVTDPLNRVTTYEYDEAGNLIKETDPLGNVTTHSYDFRGLRTSTTWPRGNAPNGSATTANGDFTSVYGYNIAGQLTATANDLPAYATSTYDVFGNLIATTDELGRATQFTYDDLDRRLSQTDALGQSRQYAYDRLGRVIQVTDELGRQTGYVYDQPNSRTTSINADGATKVQTFDLAGNLTSSRDENGNLTRFVYDSRDRLIATVYADGSRELRAYDDVGNLKSLTDPSGNTTRYTYDQRDRLLTETDALGGVTRYEYDKVGNLTKSTDPLNHATTITYDKLDRPLELTDPLGNHTTTTYDANGNIKTIKDPAGNVQTMVYDVADRLVETIDPLGQIASLAYDRAGNILTATDANGHATHYEYDALNRTTATIDAQGHRSEEFYDAVGRVIRRKDTLGRETNFVFDVRDRLLTAYDPFNGPRSYTYDTVGNVLSFTDELGFTTRYAYDDRYRRTTVTNALGDRQEYLYDAGHLVSSADELGRFTVFTYDKLNRVIATRDTGNEHWLTSYDAAGNVSSTTDPLGRLTSYTYDALNRLLTTTDPLGGVWTTAYDSRGNVISATDANTHTTTSTYDALNRIIAVTDPAAGLVQYAYDPVGNLITTTDQRGNVTSYTYDELNRLLTTTDAAGGLWSTTYDSEGNPLTTTDANNHTTTYVYDLKNRLIKATDALGGVAEFIYDGADNLLSQSDELHHVTSFLYDFLHRLVQTTDPAGNSQLFAYDPVGNLVTSTDELGRVTKYAYDELDRVTKTTDPLNQATNFTYDAVGNRLTIKDRLDRVTRFTYDDLNRLTQVKDALDGTVKTAYDAVGNVKSVTDQLNRKTSYQYDALDRLTKTTDPLNFETQFAYDATSNLKKTTDQLGRETNYKYDKLNRLTEQTDAAGGISKNTYDAVGNRTTTTDELNRTTTYAYDALNRPVSVTDPLNHTTTSTYDAVGNLLKITDPLGHFTSYAYDLLNRRLSATDPLNAVTAFQYDAVGNLTRLTDPKNNATTYEYDANDRLIKETNPLSVPRTYAYDPDGNLTLLTDRNGRKIQYTYDDLNRRTKEEWLTAQGQPTHTFVNTFDAASQLTSASDPASSYAFTYDADGQTLTASNAGTTGVPAVVFTYARDAAHNLTSRSETIGGTAAATNSYTYDALNRPTKIAQSGTGVAPKRVDLAYDAASQPLSQTRYSDLAGTQLVAATANTFDADGRLTGRTHQKDQTVLAAYGLTYDAADRITSLTSPDGVANYTYDNRNQLTAADHSTQADEGYTYDNNGNRVSVTAGSSNNTYTTGPDNRLTSDGTYTYQYDAEGNRTQRTNIATGDVTQYFYDFRNRLISVNVATSGGQTLSTAHYTYDVFNNRIAKSVDADGAGTGVVETTRFVLDGNQIALQFDAAGNLTHRYLYGPGIDQILAEDNYLAPHPGVAVLWPLTDHEGTIRDIADASGAIVNHITYDSFGRQLSETNAAIDHLFGYTGRELDDETGLMYYRARYYDPATAQFISQDPLSFSAGDPNLYRYVGNNPLSLVDPSGLGGAPCFKLKAEESENAEQQAQLRQLKEMYPNGWDSGNGGVQPPAPPSAPPPTNTGGGDPGGSGTASSGGGGGTRSDAPVTKIARPNLNEPRSEYDVGTESPPLPPTFMERLVNNLSKPSPKELTGVPLIKGMGKLVLDSQDVAGKEIRSGAHAMATQQHLGVKGAVAIVKLPGTIAQLGKDFAAGNDKQFFPKLFGKAVAAALTGKAVQSLAKIPGAAGESFKSPAPKPPSPVSNTLSAAAAKARSEARLKAMYGDKYVQMMRDAEATTRMSKKGLIPDSWALQEAAARANKSTPRQVPGGTPSQAPTVVPPNGTPSQVPTIVPMKRQVLLDDKSSVRVTGVKVNAETGVGSPYSKVVNLPFRAVAGSDALLTEMSYSLNGLRPKVATTLEAPVVTLTKKK